MRQLEPGRAAALLGAHQVGVDQRPDRAVVEPLAALGRLQHLATNTLRRDQLAIEPHTYIAFAHTGRGGDRVHSLGVVVGQRGVHIANRADIVGADPPRIGGQLAPQAVAHYLELHRLEGRPELLLGAAVGPLDIHPAQIVDQARGGRVVEIDAEQGGPLDGLARSRGRADRAETCWRAGLAPGAGRRQGWPRNLRASRTAPSAGGCASAAPSCAKKAALAAWLVGSTVRISSNWSKISTSLAPAPAAGRRFR